MTHPSDDEFWLDRPIGIDLGTTNSAAAMSSPDGQSIWLAEDSHGRAIEPSVVGWDPDAGDLVTGFTAWNRRGLSPEPVQSVKRKMGLDQVVEVGPHPMTPAEVSAEIVRAQMTRMRAFVERAGLGHLRATRAVVTVPAYFDAPQIEATRTAGELAGVEVLGLLQEPTAACMYCVWKRGFGDGNFLVYDLGGGTFDVSVIRCLFGEYQVLGIHGDNYLGGDDFDRRLAEHFRNHLVGQGYDLDLDLEDDSDAFRFLVLTRIARTAKETLSVQPVHYVAHRDIFEDHAGKLVTLELELSRSRWEALMADFVASTIRCCHEALARATEKAKIGLADIDHVLLVGGSTRVPLVQAEVARAFCGDGLSKAEAPIMEAPDSCVALGAAIHAANLGATLIGRDGDPMRLAIRSTLASVADRTRVAGEVLGADDHTADATVLLKDDVGATLAIEALDGNRFKLTDVPLPVDGRNPVVLELMSSSGATVAEFPFDLYRASQLRHTGSALSNPTVLAKDIYLEVQREGRLDRKILISRGSTLPTTERWRLYTADRSGAVILTLLQNRYPISSIHLSVPDDLAVGTPVELEISIDETMAMTAQGGVAGQTFWATVEPPASRALESWAAIEARLDRAETLGDSLWGHEARVWRRDAPFLVASIREAARTDPDKLQVLVGRLDDLLDFLGQAGGELSPGFERFEILLDNTRRIVLREDATLGQDLDTWERRVGALRDEGREAWDAREQTRWSRIYAKAQALFETVSQDERRFVQTGSIEHIASLYNSGRFRLELLKEKLEQVVMPRSPETRRLREAALDDIRSAMAEEIVAPLDRIGQAGIEASSQMRADLDRINTIAKQLDRRLTQLPSLGVVKTDD